MSDLSNDLPSIIVAAHELKAPLALVRQLSLSLEEGDFDISEQRRMLNQICLTSERALRLTSDLTKTARLNEPLFKLEPINPKQLCEDVVFEMMPIFKAKKRKIELSSNRKTPLVVGNRDLLRRLLMNFSDNAIHYTESSDSIKIKISAFKCREVVRIGVRDFGPALPKNTLKSLSGNLNGEYLAPVQARPQSSGLGLYIVKQFADAMNAQVGFIRHRDGATFYVDLQLSKQLSLL